MEPKYAHNGPCDEPVTHPGVDPAFTHMYTLPVTSKGGTCLWRINNCTCYLISQHHTQKLHTPTPFCVMQCLAIRPANDYSSCSGVLTSAIWQTPNKLSYDIYPVVACVQPLYTLREWWMECCGEGRHSFTSCKPHLCSCFCGVAWEALSNCDENNTNCQQMYADVQYFPQIILMRLCTLQHRFNVHTNYISLIAEQNWKLILWQIWQTI